MTTAHGLKLSVVVPTYRRPDLLERCLASLQNQTLPSCDYEIIVCDDGPSTMAETVVQQASASKDNGPVIRYLAVTASQGPAGARNCGWKAALAPIIAFTDDDTKPNARWLEAGLAAMQPGVHAATGQVQMPLPLRPSDYELDAAELTRAEFVTANCFIQREVLHQVNGFDERFTMAWREDSDLHFTLLEQHYNLVEASNAIVVPPLRSASFAAGVGMQKKVMFDVLLYRKHPRLYRERIRRSIPWLYLLISILLVAAIISTITGRYYLGLALSAAWAFATGWFFARRLVCSSWTVRNAVELFVTSICIPPLSIFWRLIGISRFGARFP